MKRVLTIVFLLSLNFGFGHDIKMAIFEISRGEGGLSISISIDKDALLTALQNSCSASLEYHQFDDAVWEYLDSNLKISVNDQLGLLHVREIEFDQLNARIIGFIEIDKAMNQRILEVQMINTCLIETVEGHDNVMKLKLNDRYRSFRMNSDRRKTIAKY